MKPEEDAALAGLANGGADGSGGGDAGVMSAAQSAPTDGAASCAASGGGGLSTAADAASALGDAPVLSSALDAPDDAGAPPSDASDAAARGLSEDELFAKLEDDYWRVVEHATGEESEAVVVDYGNDLDTPSYWSGFPTREAAAPPPPPPSDAAGAPPPPPTAAANPELPSPEQLRRCEWGSTEHVRQSGWNLNNLPAWPGSVLRHFRVPVPGINVPWLYVGMLFSTFCWHNEDNYLASINVNHVGAPKQWYGVPGASSSKFEDVVRKFLSQTIKKIPDLLHHMNTQFSPSLLRANGVPVYQVRQNPGEFVVTFPQAFHGGFSYGFNVGEAVNFANTQWIKHAHVANERYRRVGRLAVLSHDRLMFTLLHHLGDLDRDSARRLFEELIRLVHEELVLRPRLYTLGVRDVSTLINLPPNRTDIIDNESSDYDDKRVCCVCQHTCFLSAVACNCSQSQVACLRHHQYMCRCQPSNKYLLAWMHDDQLETQLRNFQGEVQRCSSDVSPREAAIAAHLPHGAIALAGSA